MKSATKPGPRTRAALLCFLLLLLGLAPAAAPARAEAPPPALQLLEVGWDGHMTAGTWTPVRVKVNGSSRDREGRVEVVLENLYQTGPNQSYRMPLGAYAQEIAIPAQSAKEVTLWVPTVHGVQGSVRLLEGDQELGREQFEFRATKAPNWPLVGALSDEESLAVQLRQIELPLQNLPTPINVARVRPEALPAIADRLKSFRAIVVRGNSPSRLTDEQRAAILQWVHNGGHLLLAGGPDSALAAAVLPPGSLPLTFAGAEMKVDLKPLLAWGAAGGQPSAALEGPAARLHPSGGSVLAGSADRPLAWRISQGLGTITVLAVDPTLEPLASWGGTVPLLKKALDAAFTAEGQVVDEKMRFINMEQEMGYRLRNVLDALPADAYPNWKLVALYLGGFALLAGPLLHLLFWRKGRRGWLWLAVPGLSLLVAGGIYLSAIPLDGRDVLGHTLSHLTIDPESQTATQVLMVGLYAPMHEQLSVTVPGGQPVSALGLLEGPNVGPGGPSAASLAKPPYRVVEGRESRVEFNANQASMRPLSLTRVLGKETGRITSHLTLEGSLLRGTVTNETPYHLEDAAVAVGTKAVRLGTMAPGEKRELTLEPGTALAGQFNQYQSFPQIFYGVPVSPEVRARMGALPPGAPEPLEVPQKPEIMRRSRMLESLLYRPTPGPNSIALPLTFIAFTQDPVGEPVIDLKGHPNHQLHLIEQRLQIELPDGAFTLPPGMIPFEMAMMNVRGMGSTSNGTVSWIEIDSGSVVYTFHQPLPKSATIIALQITTQMVGTPQPTAGMGKGRSMPANPAPEPAELGIFQIYNVSTASWENLPPGQMEVRLTDPARYLGPGGEVKLQVVSGGDRLVRFVVPSLSIEGRGGR